MADTKKITDWEEVYDWEEVSSPESMQAQVDDWEEITDWEDTTSAEPTISQLESGLRGAAQGVTFGFADEISGGSNAVYNYLLNKYQGNDSTFTDEYRKARDESRDAFKAAQDANPMTYMAGEVGGGIGTLAIPGLGLGNLFRGGKVANIAARGALEAGAYGLGTSEGETITENLTDAAKSAGMGAALGVGMNKAGSAVKGLSEKVLKSKPTEKVAKKVSNLAFDLPDEFSEQIIKHGKKFKGAKAVDQIQEDVVHAVKNLRKDIAAKDTLAWNTLSKKPQYIAKAFAKEVDDVLFDKKVLGLNAKKEVIESSLAADKKALSKALEIKDQLQKIGELSQDDVKTLIQKIDNEINWDKQDLVKSNEILKSIRDVFDSRLKTDNVAYADKMSEVAPKVKMLMGLKKDLRLDAAFNPTDTTVSKLKSLKSPHGETKRMFAEENLENLSKYKTDGSPLSFLEDLDIVRVDQRTKTGVAQGSRNTLAGALLGGPIGGALGYAKDKYGRIVGKNVLSGAANTIKSSDKFLEKLGKGIEKLDPKYLEVLQKAGQRGVNAVAVTHFLLANQDEEYRRAFEEEDED
jgi:hypothetical protein